jgi:predicted DNA-binding transcriptional regulator YafY
MGATILRQWMVLAMLPRPPRRIDTAAIAARLRERGIEVCRRTIQRDLLELAEIFPIVADECARPYGWAWSDDAELGLYLSAPQRVPRAASIDVSLRLRRRTMSSLLDLLGARNARLVDGDGASDVPFVTALVEVEDTGVTRRVLLGHADEVEVLSPFELRREIAERARRARDLHSRRAGET